MWARWVCLPRSGESASDEVDRRVPLTSLLLVHSLKTRKTKGRLIARGYQAMRKKDMFELGISCSYGTEGNEWHVGALLGVEQFRMKMFVTVKYSWILFSSPNFLIFFFFLNVIWELKFHMDQPMVLFHFSHCGFGFKWWTFKFTRNYTQLIWLKQN